MKFRFSIFFLLLVFIGRYSSAQTNVNITSDKKSILLGEPFHVSIDATVPSTFNIAILPDSISHFEMVEPLKIDSSRAANSTKLKIVYTLTSFDSGRWVIPPISFARNLSTDSLVIEVGYTPGFDPLKPYNGIKDILETEPTEKKTKWWWYAIGAVAAAVLVLLAYRQFKKQPAPKPQVNNTIDPYREAMQALQDLSSASVSSKEFYSRLTDIVRVYLFKRKGMASLQKTTNDLMLQVNSIGLSPGIYEELSNAMRISDFVKFAKYQPATEDNRLVWEQVRKGIEAIENTVSSTQAAQHGI